MIKKIILLTAFYPLAFALYSDDLSAQYQISGWAFGGGGGEAQGNGHSMRTTIGQPVTGLTYGEELMLQSGFWYLAGSSLVTSVEERAGEIPETYTLKQNYPNPFNPSTTIRFALPEAGDVQLVVYDMLGREVATLVDDHKQAGSYDVRFDAGHLSSGVYIYQLRAGDFVESKRLMLVK